MDKNKKKVLILSILGLIGLVVVTVGITYAIFTYTKLGTTDNTITTGTLKFLYTENTGVKTGIKLTNALPMSDTKGKALDGDNNVFDFSIEATNTGTETIPYEVTLRKKSTSTLAEQNVKVYLTDRTDATEKEELEPTNFNKLTQTNIDVGNEVEKTIYKSSVGGNTTNYKKDFRLRMWVDDTKDSNDIYGKEFTAMVNVYSNAKVISEEEQELRSNTDIQRVTVGDDILTKVEGQDYDYAIKLPNTISSIPIKVSTKSSLATVEISKNNSDIINYNGENIIIETGDNIYNIKVISADKSNTIEEKLLISSIKTEKVSIFGKTYVALDTTPTLTTSLSNTNDLTGLYKSTATNTGKATYYFRGAVKNNYVSFAGQTWRILRINEDGTIRMIMQDGINNNASYGFNTSADSQSNMYYSNSNIAKPTLEDWYNTNIENNINYSKYVVAGNYYCEQAKVKYLSRYTSENTNMALYSDYIPNFKCESDINNKGIVNSNIGLITYDEYIYSGGYIYPTTADAKSTYCASEYESHTMSPAGYYSSIELATNWAIKMYAGYSTATNGYARLHMVLRPVINIKTDTVATGTGTSTDPFVIG